MSVHEQCCQSNSARTKNEPTDVRPRARRASEPLVRVLRFLASRTVVSVIGTRTSYSYFARVPYWYEFELFAGT
eukprot:scaffold234951_cov22-Prasinocladus_malaysianus.AAC.1